MELKTLLARLYILQDVKTARRLTMRKIVLAFIILASVGLLAGCPQGGGNGGQGGGAGGSQQQGGMGGGSQGGGAGGSQGGGAGGSSGG
jgi:hypothetical protein